MLRGLLVGPLALFVIACGPDAVVMPPSGVYLLAAETVENSCPHPFDESQVDAKYAVRVEDDSLDLPAADYLAPPACESCTPFVAWRHWQYTLDEDGRYTTGEDGTLAGCRHEVRMVADVLDERTIQARITDEWSDDEDCAWLKDRSCATVREYTYTLVEACEGCTHDELQAKLGY